MQNSLVVEALSANQTEQFNYTFGEYLSELDLPIEENCELEICKVSFGVNNDFTLSENAAMTAQNYEEEHNALLVKRYNDDGTITDRVIFSVYENSDTGELESIISDETVRQINENSDSSVFSISSNIDNIILGASSDSAVTTRQHTFYLDATYSSINMVNYGSSGKAYVPVSSEFEISRRSGTTALGTTTFYTIINAYQKVLTSDPTQKEVGGGSLFLESIQQLHRFLTIHIHLMIIHITLITKMDHIVVTISMLGTLAFISSK